LALQFETSGRSGSRRADIPTGRRRQDRAVTVQPASRPPLNSWILIQDTDDKRPQAEVQAGWPAPRGWIPDEREPQRVPGLLMLFGGDCEWTIGVSGHVSGQH